MANVTYTGTGVITSADFHAVKWVGKSKGGSPVTIELSNAINKGGIDMTFAEKDDVVLPVTFEACYDNTDEYADDFAEPWKITVDGALSGASSIVLGTGMFYIDGDPIGLTRGGGSFNVEREIREINADGDRGAVLDRVVMESSRASITMNVLTPFNGLDKLLTAIASN